MGVDVDACNRILADRSAAAPSYAVQPTFLKGVVLRPHQLDGLNFLIFMHQAGRNALLADDMGLGKTLQLLSFLAWHKEKNPSRVATPRYLVLAPLATLSQWVEETTSRIANMKITAYIGDAAVRSQMAEDPSSLGDIVVTHYDIFIRDAAFFNSIRWAICSIDEAHRLKNSQAILTHCLMDTSFRCERFVLLTGTPIQNDTRELWSILHFLDKSLFNDYEAFSGLSVADMGTCLAAFSIRRTKSQALPDLPPKYEYVMSVPLTELQRQLYRSILLKYPVSQDVQVPVSILRNLAVQLRKCSDHPYIFPGVEPEPFEVGDHLIDASGKLVALDILLMRLRKEGSRVLVFSQLTSMLDILQDYLEYRQWQYARLDGSLRGGERFAAVDSFQQDPKCFVFLMSTRAGGLGLNLTVADAVVFFDCDWNPFVDLQAQERVYRMGQKKVVRVFRLLAKATIDEVIVRRAERKKLLSQEIIETTEDVSQPNGFVEQLSGPKDLKEIIRFGVSQLLDEDAATAFEEFRQSMVNRLDDIFHHHGNSEQRTVVEKFDNLEPSVGSAQDDASDSIHWYEGRDAREDEIAYRKILESAKVHVPDGDALDSRLTRAMRHRREIETEALSWYELSSPQRPAKKRKPYAEYLQDLWQKHHYSSFRISVDDARLQEATSRVIDISDEAGVRFVVGDVTDPKYGNAGVRVICHIVDNSGHWGRGGVFGALDRAFPSVAGYYEKSVAMHNCKLGDVHLIPVSGPQEGNNADGLMPGIYVALLVNMRYNRSRAARSDIDQDLWTLSLRTLREYLLSSCADCHKDLSFVSLHFPHAGNSRDTWYACERLLKANMGPFFDTFVYYYPRQSGKPPNLLAAGGGSSIQRT